MTESNHGLASLKTDFDLWKGRFVDLEAGLKNSQDRFNSLVEADLDGRAKPAEIKTAKAEMDDLFHKVQAARKKVSSLRGDIEKVYQGEYQNRRANHPVTVEKLESERAGAIEEIKFLCAKLQYLAACYLSARDRENLGIDRLTLPSDADFSEEYPGAEDYHRRATQTAIFPDIGALWIQREVIRACGPDFKEGT